MDTTNSGHRFSPWIPTGSRRYDLATSEDEDEDVDEQPTVAARRLRQRVSHNLLALTKILLLLAAGVFVSGLLGFEQLIIVKDPATVSSCQEHVLRREWRSLSTQEKQSYIESVQCLKRRPSILGLNHSLHDDFPWVHKFFGESCTPYPRPKARNVLDC